MSYLIQIETGIMGEYIYVTANSKEGLKEVINGLKHDNTVISITPLNGTIYTTGVYIKEITN